MQKNVHGCNFLWHMLTISHRIKHRLWAPKHNHTRIPTQKGSEQADICIPASYAWPTNISREFRTTITHAFQHKILPNNLTYAFHRPTLGLQTSLANSFLIMRFQNYKEFQCFNKCNMAYQKQITISKHKHFNTRQTITNIVSTNHMLEPGDCLAKMLGNICSNSARAQNPMTNPDRATIHIACDVFRRLRAHAMCSSETIVLLFHKLPRWASLF